MKKSGEKAPRDLAPLWAVGRTLVHKAVNMRFETLVFDVSPIAPIGRQLPGASKTAGLWTASVQALVNTKKLAEHDLLQVSAMEVGTGDEEESD